MKTLHLGIIIFSLSVFLYGISNTSFAQTTQHYFDIWPTDKMKQTGLSQTLQGNICPTPAPDPHTNSSIKIYHSFFPWNSTVYFLGQNNTLPFCSQSSSIFTFKPNVTGVYHIYATAQWTENGKLMTVQSSPVEFQSVDRCYYLDNSTLNMYRFHPGDVASLRTSFDTHNCNTPSVNMQVTVYNFTGNTQSNIIYQKSKHLTGKEEGVFNFTMPKWTDSNGIFHFLVNENYTGNVPDESFSYDYFSVDNAKIPKSYDLTMWTDSPSFSIGTNEINLFLKSCPFTPPTDDNLQEKTDPVTGLITSPGSDILVEHHLTLPDGTTKMQQSEISELQDCSAKSSAQIVAHKAGTWHAYDTIKWIWENSTHELNTNTINFTVTALPSQQLKSGTQIDSVKCYPPFELHIKDSTKPLCIKPETYDKLASRGYFLQ
ncbi:MAG: hypothetical protein KGI27_02675 [Thaumarchaeota archaeon]|nr:hypothetical protein [Nitrososphaerota archaeon]